MRQPWTVLRFRLDGLDVLFLFDHPFWLEWKPAVYRCLIDPSGSEHLLEVLIIPEYVEIDDRFLQYSLHIPLSHTIHIHT